MTSLKSLTFHGVKWYLLGDGANIISNFLIGIILARLLTPEDFGTIGVYGIFFALANIFINGGFSMSLIQKRDITDIDKSTAFWTNVISGMFFFFFFFFIAQYIADFFGITILRDIIRLSSLNLVIGSFTIVQSTLFNKRVDFRTTSAIRFVSSLIAGIICIVLAYRQWGIWSLVIQGLAGGIISAVLLWYFSTWRPKLKFSFRAFRSMFAFGGGILGTRLLECLSGQATAFVIGKGFSPRDLGFYQKGAAYARLLSTSISNALLGVSFPVLTQIDDDERLIYVMRRYIKFTSLIIFFFMLLLFALANPIIVLLYTAKWEPSALILQIVILGLMFDHVIGINNTLFNVKGRSDILLRLQIFKSIIFLSLISLSIPFGLYAVCAAEVVYYQIAMIICTRPTKTLVGYGYFQQIRDILPYLIMSLLAVSPCFLLINIGLPNFITILIGGLVALAFYVSILYVRKDIIFMQYIWNNAKVKRLKDGLLRKVSTKPQV